MTGHHDRNGFDCGVEPLNRWLQQTALQHQGKGISRTFVAVPGDGSVAATYEAAGYESIAARGILGFYALASAFVLLDDLPAPLARRYPRQIPVTRLGRLGVRLAFQGQGLGRLLLADALTRARAAALVVGSAGLFVDAKDENGARFYQRYGFQPAPTQPQKLFLPFW